MTATDYLTLVYRWLPTAFFMDLFLFTFGLYWLNRWRKARAFRKKIEPYTHHR